MNKQEIESTDDLWIKLTNYKVSFKKNGFSVGVHQRDGSVKAVFTKDELAEYGFNNLDEYDVTEVEE